MTVDAIDREELKRSLAQGNALAAVHLARSYARDNKRKESCVCLRIAQLLDPTQIVPEDMARHAKFWAGLGGQMRQRCFAKADQAVLQIRLNKQGSAPIA